MFNFFLRFISQQYADKQDHYINPVISGTSDNNAYKTPNIIKSCCNFYSKSEEKRKKIMSWIFFLFVSSLCPPFITSYIHLPSLLLFHTCKASQVQSDQQDFPTKKTRGRWLLNDSLLLSISYLKFFKGRSDVYFIDNPASLINP